MFNLLSKTNNNEYNIVYATDDRFCGVMGVSIASLMENNKDARIINLTILSTDVSENNKKKINTLVQNYGRKEPKWVSATNIEEKLSMRISKDRGSLSQYARIFLNDIFDASIKKILYLDCDTIVDGSIYDLWNLNLKNNIIGALKDSFSKYYRKNLGLAPKDIMFNSGVMIIDMVKWRKYKVEEKVINFIVKHNGKIQQGDQGALNAVLSKVTYAISPQYNFISIFTNLSYDEMVLYRQPVNFYSRNDIRLAKENPIIIHFTSSYFNQRPWEKGCKSEYLNKWLEYRSLTPWKNKKLEAGKNNLIKILYGIFPRRLFLSVASIFQVYLRPWKNHLIMKLIN